MTQAQWTAVDRYITTTLVGSDAALESALEASRAAGLPAYEVSPNQGKLLELLARLQGARRILEIGTLGGYSTIWLARGMSPQGRLVSLELDPKSAEVARTNVDRAGLGACVEVRIGPALETLPMLAKENQAPFDLVFIDADKKSNADYFAWALQLSRVGTLIIVDNVIREGTVVDVNSTDPGVQGVRRLNQLMASERRVSATAIQTVGEKGYDGFAFALVVEGASEVGSKGDAPLGRP